MLRKQRLLMDLCNIFGSQATFRHEGGEVVTISTQQWNDMRCPSTITVTIRPGDRLNAR